MQTQQIFDEIISKSALLCNGLSDVSKYHSPGRNNSMGWLSAKKDAGNIYGRCNVVGITLQIVGKSPDHGLKGCEIPDGQADDREISGSIDFASGGAPFNFNQGKEVQSCYNGGTWKAIQDGSTIHVTVSGYKVDLTKLPATDANVSSVFPYYNPETIKNYWNIQMACFSGGELWIVQPFYDKNGNYVVDQYGIGGFKTTLINSKLDAAGFMEL